MNAFEQIVEWFRRFWEWLKSLFGGDKPTKKPLLKITILTTFIMFFMVDNASAQRTELQGLWAFFDQPGYTETDSWRVDWHNSHNDSLHAYKNDTLRVSIKNELGEWVSTAYIPTVDTVEVRIKLDRPFGYDTEMTFSVTAINADGESGADSVKTLFMASDMNHIPDEDMDIGYRTGDDSVDGLDLIELAKNWGRTGLSYRDFVDINGDGYVDGLDLIQLSKDWGRTYTP
jgi:hypothetical protein